jgi:carbon-monoxide dehydrogenase large subunit
VRWRGVADLGAHLTLEGALTPFATAHLVAGAYNVPSVEVSIAGVYTNKTPLTGGVAAGRAEAAFFIERLIDMGAAELELDPVELRRVNFPRSFPHVGATGISFDAIECPAALDRLLEAASHARLRAEVESRRSRGELVGIGLAAYIDLVGASVSSPALAPGWESAAVSVSAGGSVEVEVGAPLFPGEGDALAGIAVKELGTPPDRASARGGDTARMAQGAGGTGSAPDADGAGAVRIAARKLASKLRRIAAAFLRAPEEYVERHADSFSTGERSVTIEEMCRRAYTDPELPDGMEPGLVATAIHARQGTLFPFGAHLAVVSIDPETGEPRLERHVAVDDAGVAIHGPWMEAWAEAAIARAIGEAFLEEAVHDEEGQLLSGTFLDYALPRARTIPPLICSRTETPTRFHPLGARGGRESSGIGALPAIVNAAVDALRPLGVRHLDPPLRPERIWRHILAQRDRP